MIAKEEFAKNNISQVWVLSLLLLIRKEKKNWRAKTRKSSKTTSTKETSTKEALSKTASSKASSSNEIYTRKTSTKKTSTMFHENLNTVPTRNTNNVQDTTGTLTISYVIFGNRKSD